MLVSEGARALARLHSAQFLETRDPSGAHIAFVEAGTEFERIVTELDLPAFRRFLARARSGASRFEEALGILDELVALDPGDTEVANERDELAAAARSLIVQRSIRNVLGGGEPSAAEVVARNRGLLDDDFQRSVHATALHYADRSDPAFADAIQQLLATLHDVTTDTLWLAIRLESGAMRQVAMRKPLAALPVLERTLDMYESLGRSEFVAGVRNHLGLAKADIGLFGSAEEDYELAIRHHQDVGDDIEAARVMENLAVALVKSSECSRGQSLAEQAAQILDSAGRIDLAAKARAVVADALAGKGQVEEALGVINSVIAIGHDVWGGRPELLGGALTLRGYILERLGRVAEARASLREAAEVLPTSRTAQARFLMPEFAGVDAEANDHEAAIQEELRALGRHLEEGMQLDAARNRLNLASLFMARIGARSIARTVVGDPEAVLRDLAYAGELLDQVIDTLQAHGPHPMLAQARRSRANLLAALGHDSAMGELIELAYNAVVSGDGMTAASILQNIAVLYVDMGLLNEASAALAAGELHGAGSHDLSLGWAIRHVRARIETLRGQQKDAAESYGWLIENYSEQEQAIGAPDLIVGWSRDKASVFEEALQLFVDSGDTHRAFEIALRAKSRTHQQLIGRRMNTAACWADVVAVLRTD
jgi:tetratricopeptide (TPR) repeat protein